MSITGQLRRYGIELNGNDVEFYRGYGKLTGRNIVVGSETVKVLLVDGSGKILLATGTTVPTGATAGYAKGAQFIKTDAGAGTRGVYENIGTTTSCNFALADAIAASEITLADGKLLIGSVANVGAEKTPAGDLTTTREGVFSLRDRFRLRVAAAINTAGAGSPSVANLIGGLVKRNPSGAARTDTLPTAADIVAGIVNAGVGAFFECVYRNEATAHAQTVTLAAPDASVTLDPATIVIQPGQAKRLLFLATNVTGAAEAVTVYDISQNPAALKGIVAAEDAYTTSRETNAGGLATAITLCTEIRADMIRHFAVAARHTTGLQDSSAFGAVPTTLAELLVTAGTLLTAYEAHNADAVLAGAWAYHSAQLPAHALVSAVTPVTLAEAVTRLNDMKAKYNLHEAEAGAGHGGNPTVAGDEVAASDAAYNGVAVVPVANVLAGDFVSWAILNDGTGNVTGITAVAGAGIVTFTFSADPQNDAIISYSVCRTLT